MSLSRRTRALVAWSLAVAVCLAALVHSHAHAFRQERSGQTTCLFCEHGVAPGPMPVALAVPLVATSDAPREPALAPLAPSLVTHPGRGPPAAALASETTDRVSRAG